MSLVSSFLICSLSSDVVVLLDYSYFGAKLFLVRWVCDLSYKCTEVQVMLTKSFRPSLGEGTSPSFVQVKSHVKEQKLCLSPPWGHTQILGDRVQAL